MANKLRRPAEIARELGVSRSTIYRWFWEGRLSGVKMGGGTVRIHQDSVETFLLKAQELGSYGEGGGDHPFVRQKSTPKEDAPLPTLVRKALDIKRKGESKG